MAIFQKNIMKVLMAFLVFFSALAPVYGATITPALKSLTFTSKTDLSSSHSSSSNMAMPCHKGEMQEKESNSYQANKQSACFKHCLQHLNEPCLSITKQELQKLDNKQSKADYFIKEISQIASTSLIPLSNKDPPLRQPHSKSKGLLPLLKQTARLRH